MTPNSKPLYYLDQGRHTAFAKHTAPPEILHPYWVKINGFEPPIKVYL